MKIKTKQQKAKWQTGKKNMFNLYHGQLLLSQIYKEFLEIDRTYKPRKKMGKGKGKTNGSWNT